MSKKVMIGKKKDLSDRLAEKAVISKPVISKVVAPKPIVSKSVVSKPVAPKKTTVNNPVLLKKSLQPKTTLSKMGVPTKAPALDDVQVQQTAKPSLIKTKVQKKSKLELPPEHETYFVYLRSPLEYRRHLLESSRKILYCLKSHQKIVLIRQKKLEEMSRLRASVKELMYLNKKFNDKLPKYKIDILGGNSKDAKDPTNASMLNNTPAKFSKSVNVVQEKTEMEKLEESLANIERKLKSL